MSTLLLSSILSVALAAEPATPAATTTPPVPHRFNVHQAMTEGGGQACALCHDHTGALDIPAADTCKGCHFKTVHVGTVEHLVPLPAEMRSRAQAAGIPLDGHKGACVSCHDPHPSGVLPRRPTLGDDLAVTEAWRAALLGEGALVKGGDLLRLPLADGALCQACHGPGPASTPTPAPPRTP